MVEAASEDVISATTLDCLDLVYSDDPDGKLRNAVAMLERLRPMAYLGAPIGPLRDILYRLDRSRDARRIAEELRREAYLPSKGPSPSSRPPFPPRSSIARLPPIAPSCTGSTIGAGHPRDPGRGAVSASEDVVNPRGGVDRMAKRTPDVRAGALRSRSRRDPPAG